MNLHNYPDLALKHHFHILDISKLWMDGSCDQIKSFGSVTAVDPVCPVSTLLTRKIEKMDILKDECDENKAASDSNLVELIKHRVFPSMEVCTIAKKYKQQLLKLNQATGLVTVQPNENPFRLTELDKRFQKGGDFEELNILDARSQLGFDENELTMINFPNSIQFQDEESFKNHNNAEMLKKEFGGKRFEINTLDDTFMDYQKMIFRHFINRFRLSQKYQAGNNAMRLVSDGYRL